MVEHMLTLRIYIINIPEDGHKRIQKMREKYAKIFYLFSKLKITSTFFQHWHKISLKFGKTQELKNKRQSRKNFGSFIHW